MPYQDPGYYADITEPTVGLLRFIGSIARHLGNKRPGGKALFHLDQGMGGGKSHALVASTTSPTPPPHFSQPNSASWSRPRPSKPGPR